VEYYNAACSSSLNRDIPGSMTFLRKAVQLESSHFENMEKDGDLANVRDDPGYEAFRAELREKLRLPEE
jgi:hypothetical protein